MPQTISLKFDAKESACLEAAAANAGLTAQDWLKRAMTRQALFEKDPVAAQKIIAGLDDVASGRVVSHDEMKRNMAQRFGQRFDG